MMTEIICALLGYLSGCIQSSYIIGRILLKQDIRKLGNGNAGASNATVSFGPGYGVTIALLDIAKGFIPLLIIKIIFNDTLAADRLVNLLYITGLLIILGHNFPFFMGFRGGKGTAAGVGVLIGIDYRFGLLALLIMIAVTLISDYIVIGTMSLLVVFVIYTLYLNMAPIPVAITMVITVMSIWKHRRNFVSIKNGTELKVRPNLFKKKKRENS